MTPNRKDDLWAQVVKNNRKSQGAKPPGPEVRLQLMPACWGPKSITSYAVVKKALDEGKAPPGKVVWLNTFQNADDMQGLAKLHEIKCDFALAVLHTDTERQLPDNAVVKKLAVSDASGNRATFKEFVLLPLAAKLPELPTDSVQESKHTPVERKLACFRVSIPEAFVAKDKWKEYCANPGTAIKQWTGTVACFHSSFAWKTVSDRDNKDTQCLSGFIKIDEKQVATLMKRSGTEGVFVERHWAEAPRRPPVKWISPNENEPMDAYFQRVREQAAAAKVGLAWRLGGSATLGLRYEDGHVLDEETMKWNVLGVPKFWNETDVIEALRGADWKDIEILSSRFTTWTIKAKCPTNTQAGVVGIMVGSKLLRLVRPQTKQMTKYKVAPIRPGTQRKDASKVAPMEEQENEDGPVAKRSRIDQDTTEERDCGGAGACGFNALAVGAAIIRSPKPDAAAFEERKDAAVTMGRTLRHEVYQYCRDHKYFLETFWAVDSKATEAMEDGKIPQTYDDWVNSLLRPKKWACGLSLHAAAKRLKVRLIVLEGGYDQPYVVRECFGQSKPGERPVVIVLRNQHYKLILPKSGATFPKQWLETEAGELAPGLSLELRGAGKSWLPSSSASSISSRKQAAPRSGSQHGSWLPPRSKFDIGSNKSKKAGSNNASWLPPRSPQDLGTGSKRSVGTHRSKVKSGSPGLTEAHAAATHESVSIARNLAKDSPAKEPAKVSAKQPKQHPMRTDGLGGGNVPVGLLYLNIKF